MFASRTGPTAGNKSDDDLRFDCDRGIDRWISSFYLDVGHVAVASIFTMIAYAMIKGTS
jgi:hypothetical protein